LWQQPIYLKYSPDLVLLRRGLFSTINHIVTELQVAFLLLLSRNRSCDNRIPFYSQKEIRFLPYYRYLCQVRKVHAPLSVCAYVGNWVF
jgi:hypothetical protein